MCVRCNPIFRFNLFAPPPASLRPNLPRVVNTFARIPGPFCPGRARSPLQSPPPPPHFAFAHTTPLSPLSRAHSPPFLLLLFLLSLSLSLFRFDNPTHHRATSSLSPGFCEDPPPPRTEPPPHQCHPTRCTVCTPLYYGVRIYTYTRSNTRLVTIRA